MYIFVRWGTCFLQHVDFCRLFWGKHLYTTLPTKYDIKCVPQTLHMQTTEISGNICPGLPSQVGGIF